MPEEAKQPLRIDNIRPPNPFDFSSICDFLEQVLALGDIPGEYSRIASFLESKANEGQGAKVQIRVHEDDQFEQAMVRAFLVVSDGLLKYKQLSPHEQEVKREFLAKGPDTSLKNALLGAGFPESFGRSVIGKRYDELKNYKLTKAILKANGVFERAFYFQIKETELTKKSIDELVTSLRAVSVAGDMKLYLDALLYKVEVASTEKSFINLKKLVAAPVSELRAQAEKELTMLSEGKSPAGKGPLSRDKLQEELAKARERHELLTDYCNQYFCSDDFIYVEKNLLQFKKAKEEKQPRVNKPILSTEFLSTVDRKLIIQLLSAFKKCYNTHELWVLKAYLVRDLIGKEGQPSDSPEYMNKYHIKKNLLLEALKRVRSDMVVEDEFTTATENKKQFMEAFEKEALQLTPKQMMTQVLPKAMREAEDLVSRAKRSVVRKEEDKEKAEEQAKQFQLLIERIGASAMGAIMDMYVYNAGRVKTKDFQSYLPVLDPQAKYLEQMVKQIDVASEKEAKKQLVTSYMSSFNQQALKTCALDKDASRMFQMYMKGLIDRIKYW